MLDRRWLKLLVSWMAARRFGFLDVVEVLQVEGIARLIDAVSGDRDRHGLAAAFEDTLVETTDRDPPRLSYGNRELVPIGGAALGRPGERFLVVGCAAARPFRFEVSYETLSSANAFRRVLGKHQGLMP